MISANQIRQQFIDFFVQRGHTFVPSWPVVPPGDPTLLFTNAGMNQFKDIFLGHRQPPYPRAVNSQKCIRVSGKHNDLEEVGLDTYHHTFFEMLGNWSFADYFKAESIEWAWELLTKDYGISPQRLWATVFAGDAEDNAEPDHEAAQLWVKIAGLPKERILFCGKKDNFWEMGASGPCGPCSEIHIDLGPDRCDKSHDPSHRCGVNQGCSRFIELWNLVFIQFNRKADGKLERLNANYVDTGAGLERLTAVLQNKKSNYDTDLFLPIIRATEDLCGIRYTSRLGVATDNAFRVIADHIRTLSFAIADGVILSNEGRGYVMRRLLRRAARFGRSLNLHEPFLYRLVGVMVDQMGQAFPEITQRAEFVASVIKAEEQAFGRTLDRGLELFEQAAQTAKQAGKNIIDGQTAFMLYDTYGFPLDLTQLMAREQGLTVDTEAFETLMEQQRSRARAAQSAASLATELAGVALPQTDDSLKYQTETCTATVIGWVDQAGLHRDGMLAENADAALVLDKTCFYAEAGGQVGDIGQIETADATFIVQTTEKIADCVLHRGRMVKGTLTVGQTVTARVDRQRKASMKNHTATHLLQWALRQVLGDTVKQQGSLVCPDYLRFDFTWPSALTDQQLAKVEALVQEKIDADLPVLAVEMDLEQAKQAGAIALFGEKYGARVRLIAIGAADASQLATAISKELCGGTHVAATGQIGGFGILKQESVAAGVRRITAMTGAALLAHLKQRAEIVNTLCEQLKTAPEQLVNRVGKLLEENKTLAKQLKTAASRPAASAVNPADLFQSAQTVGAAKVITAVLPQTPLEQMRTLIDSLKQKAKSAVIVLGAPDADGKVVLLAGVTDDLLDKIKAGDIVKQIAPIVGGGGGGRPQLAQAGGKDPDKLPDAVEKAKQLAIAALT